ncbi:hypothetical protein AUJ67_08470 [Candidatus Desantisbacteria bacterium CG1_02_49_89]|nr:MAG: hypothetical protein AUJ67_08470 [Candidatus Desantisbacteria bacterium CG1_02_49_89]
MEKDKIIEILGNWNFWNRDLDAGIPRVSYLSKMQEMADTGKIISITGVRRSGKSTLIKQMAKAIIMKGINKENILLINFEEPYFENANLNMLVEIYNAYLEIIKPTQKPFLFLDEVQNVEKWEKFARSMTEKNEAFVTVTGSSSKLLSKELASILTGRQLYFEIFPLSFGEFLSFSGIEIKDKKDIPLNSLNIRKSFRNYLYWGGFPEIVLNKSEDIKRRILLSYYEDIINRDIIQRYKIKKSGKLKTLVHFYLSNPSSYASFNKISKFIDLPVETVRRFSSYIEASNLVFFVKRFSYSLKEQENSPRKIYCIDNGLSEIAGFKFSGNLGRLAENVVALKLKRMVSWNPAMEFYYWKNHYGDKEVDFVIKEGKSVKSLIQVCWDIEDARTKERELKDLVKAMNEFGLKTGIIVTEGSEGTEKIKGKTIVYQPLWKYLLEE